MKFFKKESFMKKNIIFSALAAFVLGGILGAVVTYERPPLSSYSDDMSKPEYTQTQPSTRTSR
jgi:hypothetical protein